jgi:ComF family protein
MSVSHIPAVPLRRLLREVADLCYPPLCASCGTFSPDDPFLCSNCKTTLDELAAAPACDLCGMSLAYPDAPCPYCQGKGIAHYERVGRIGRYDPPLKLLVHNLKYHRRWIVGELLADRLLACRAARAILEQADCIVPVPLHRVRQFLRGYNQAQVIADRLSRKSSVPMVDAVVRQRYTRTQTHLHSRHRRMLNLRGAFKLIDPQQVHRRRVVVIDDVFTTGATLQTLARALRPAKPASLCAIVLAVAAPKSQATSQES